MEYEHFEGSAEISVTFVDNEKIAQLNEQYRNKPQATDCLLYTSTLLERLLIRIGHGNGLQA